jgi:hypothetical protein
MSAVARIVRAKFVRRRKPILAPKTTMLDLMW